MLPSLYSDCPWRSILFVPAHVSKFLERAVKSNADAVQLDLEDSVPASLKTSARGALLDAAKYIQSKGVDVLVRVNRPLPLAVEDVQAAVRCGAKAISISKAEGPQHLQLLEEVIAEEEYRLGILPGTTRLIALVESPRAYGYMRAIASATPRMAAMMLGSEDFAVECGALPDDEVLLAPKQAMVIAARAAGIAPLGYIGTIANFRDLDAFRAMVRRSKRFGFQGGTCIHPSQVAVLNAEFGLSPEEVDFSKRLLAAYGGATTAGRGALEFEGRMVDLPMVERARRNLQRAVYLEAKAAHANSATQTIE